MPYTGPLTKAALSALDGLNCISSNDSLSSVTNSQTSSASMNSSSSSLDMHFIDTHKGLRNLPTTLEAIPKSLFVALGKHAAAADHLPPSNTRSSDLNSSTSSLSTIVPHRPGQDALSKGFPMPPLLRKKSGDIVRSSLKLPLLARCNSMPAHKNVRFSSMLEDVKRFNEFEMPLAVSADVSPVGTPRRETRRRANFNWNYSSESSDDDFDLREGSESDLSDLEGSTANDVWKITSTNLPAPTALAFTTPTILLSVVSSDTDMLTGEVYVQNLSFEKRVAVKLTVDNWKTSTFVHGSYVSSNKQTNYDMFRFVIHLANLNFSYFDRTVNLEFCVRYEVGSATYWDSNGGPNYKVRLLKQQPPPLKTKLSMGDVYLLPLRTAREGRSTGRFASLNEFATRYSFENVSSEYRCTDSYFPPQPSAAAVPLGASRAAAVGGTGAPIPASTGPALSTPIMKPRYSNKYKQKHQPALVSTVRPALTASASVDTLKELSLSQPLVSTLLSSPSTPPVAPARPGLSLRRSDVGSLSYTDLLKSYCFFKGDGVDHSLPTTFV